MSSPQVKIALAIMLGAMVLVLALAWALVSVRATAQGRPGGNQVSYEVGEYMHKSHVTEFDTGDGHRCVIMHSGGVACWESR